MRKFKGNLTPERRERNFETKRLRAYLNGWQFFCFGGVQKNSHGIPVRNYFSTDAGTFSHALPLHRI